MGIVTRNTTQFLALQKANALLHLLSLSNSPNSFVGANRFRVQANRPDITQSISGTKVIFRVTVSQGPLSSLKMALIADGILSDGIQFGRIHDSIDEVRGRFLMVGDM